MIRQSVWKPEKPYGILSSPEIREVFINGKSYFSVPFILIFASSEWLEKLELQSL